MINILVWLFPLAFVFYQSSVESVYMFAGLFFLLDCRCEISCTNLGEQKEVMGCTNSARMPTQYVDSHNRMHVPEIYGKEQE